MSGKTSKHHGHKWQPGESGNPTGRPKKGESMSDILRKKLLEIHPEKRVTHREVIADKLIEMAEEGDARSIGQIYDRVEGKPVQAIRVDGNIELDAPIHIVLTGVEISTVDDDEEGVD